MRPFAAMQLRNTSWLFDAILAGRSGDALVQEIPNLSVKHLRAVVALGRYGSFIAASTFLKISQPGLSRIIQQAEAMLGTSLFVRGTRSVVQTAAGREFIPVAERLLGELSQQAQRIRSLDGKMPSQLIIAGLMSICRYVLPAALSPTGRSIPKCHSYSRGVGVGVHEDIRSGFADFGIGNVTGLNEAIAVEAVSRRRASSCCHGDIRSRTARSSSLGPGRG